MEGGSGPDVLVDADPSAGNRLIGGPGADTLSSRCAGRAADADELQCGRGADRASVDGEDATADCEALTVDGAWVRGKPALAVVDERIVQRGRRLRLTVRCRLARFCETKMPDSTRNNRDCRR